MVYIVKFQQSSVYLLFSEHGGVMPIVMRWFVSSLSYDAQL